jgi:hypothetical protein
MIQGKATETTDFYPMTSAQRTAQGSKNFSDGHLGIGLLKLREALR